MERATCSEVDMVVPFFSSKADISFEYFHLILKQVREPRTFTSATGAQALIIMKATLNNITFLVCFFLPSTLYTSLCSPVIRRD